MTRLRILPDRESLRPVTNAHPCPVCEQGHKCSTGDGGLILCGRRAGPVPGFRHLGQAQGDSQFQLYRVEKQDEPHTGLGTKCRPRTKPDPPTARKDWDAVARRFADRMTPVARAELAARLSLPVEALGSLPLVGVAASSADGRTFSFPEVNPAGTVAGIVLRSPNGTKRMVKGGSRGLTLPTGWKSHPGALLVVEGASDALALAQCELAVVGRFSNTGGAEHLAYLLRNWPTDRDIIFIAENDAKPDGAWPGRDGAFKTAADLAGRLSRHMRVSLTPDGAKDARAWVVERAAGAVEAVDWPGIGRQFFGRLEPIEVVPPTPRPRIVIGEDEHRVNDEAALALGTDPEVYQRGRVLVRVTGDPPPVSTSIRRPVGPRIEALGLPTLRERLTRHAIWRKIDPRKAEAPEGPAHPPMWSVQAVHNRGVWPAVRVLEGVVEYPAFLPDGRILTTPGYDAATGLLYHPPAGLGVNLPTRPTRATAGAAAGRLLDVVADFPFAGAADRAAWLAALLTPLARFAFPGPAPLFLADGNCRGVGKGLLLDVAARVVTGQGFAVCTYTSDKAELSKLVTSIATQGDRMVLFDNLDGPFGNGVIDAALTGEAWQGRLLGTNTTARVPLFTTWYATGNNVTVVGDTARRVCPVRLETPLETPERRGDFRRPDLLGWVGDYRADLLADALTVLMAWHLAGRPDMKPAPWGSFAGWSAVVRNAVIWCGLGDPGDTRAVLQERADTTTDAMRAVLVGLERLDPDRRGLTAADILIRVYVAPPLYPESWFHDLSAALDELSPRRDSRELGYKLRSYRRRVIDGRFLDMPVENAHRSARWVVRPASAFRGNGGSLSELSAG